ncbi:MAG: hypothetical protein ACTSW1_07545 [Candidatus Hodarchaeales archaeon]
MSELITQDYKNAITVQSGGNIVAIVNSLHRTIQRMKGMGGLELQGHPIIKLYATQLSFLTEVTDWQKAHDECERKEKEGTDVTVN